MGMSNVLKVSLQATIYGLHGRGWSRRRIARELGMNRETVGRYLLLAKPAISIAGKSVSLASKKSPVGPGGESSASLVSIKRPLNDMHKRHLRTG